MKSEFDKEIDSLLRRALPSAAAAASQHLDADELSAYAEHALPAPTRARFAAHLADCARCRKMVTTVALSGGHAGELERAGAAADVASMGVVALPGWRARLAALLAPRTLGYALPLLALGIIGIIAFVAMQKRFTSEPQTAARQSESANTQVAVATNPTTADVATNTTATNTNSTSANANLTIDERPATPSAAASTGGAQPSVSASPGGPGAANSPADRPADRPAGREPREAVAPMPPAATIAAPPPAPTGDNDFREDAAARRQTAATATRPAAVTSNAAGQAAGGNANAADSTRDAAADAAAESRRAEQGRAEKSAAAAARKETRGLSNKVAERDNSALLASRAAAPKVSDERERAQTAGRRRASGSSPDAGGGSASANTNGETRSAAGHKFRRQGGAWVDVKYGSGMSTINIRRGTEQFRAVIADLPELERIAGQFGGEVIAVVGGRAYRIR